MKTYYIEVSYRVVKSVYIDAESEASARDKAMQGQGDADQIDEQDYEVINIEEQD